MSRQLHQLSLEELKKLLKIETKRFVNGLDEDLDSEELQLIRQKIKELSGLLDKKTNPKENDSK